METNASLMREKTMAALGITEGLVVGTALAAIDGAADSGTLEIPLYKLKDAITSSMEMNVPSPKQMRVKACSDILLREELPKMGFTLHVVNDMTVVRW